MSQGLPWRPGIPPPPWTLHPVTQHSGAGKSRCQLTLTPEGCRWASLGRTFANRNKPLKDNLTAAMSGNFRTADQMIVGHVKGVPHSDKCTDRIIAGLCSLRQIDGALQHLSAPVCPL